MFPLLFLKFECVIYNWVLEVLCQIVISKMCFKNLTNDTLLFLHELVQKLVLLSYIRNESQEKSKLDSYFWEFLCESPKPTESICVIRVSVSVSDRHQELFPFLHVHVILLL